MKRFFLTIGVVVTLTMSSCRFTERTATIEKPTNSILTSVAADLDISPTRIVFTYRPTKEENRAGLDNAVNCAVASALKENGNAHVLVGMEYTMKAKLRRAKEITVTGFPAKYKNFRNLLEGSEPLHNSAVLNGNQRSTNPKPVVEVEPVNQISSYYESFRSGKFYKTGPSERKRIESAFVSEIEADIKSTTNIGELEIVRTKIEFLRKYQDLSSKFKDDADRLNVNLKNKEKELK